jgi:hypothetical protein
MNQWSRTRKRFILTLVILALLVLVGVPLFLLLYKAPSCGDGRANGDETGVDCGGSCQRICAPESLPLIVKGDPRLLKLSDNFYEIVALLNNPNTQAGIRRARYTFKLFNATSLVPIKTITGITFIPPGSALTIFEGPFTIEEGSVPTRVMVEWEEDSLVWERGLTPSPQLDIRSKTLTRADTAPRLEVVLSNSTLEMIKNLDLTALLYDEWGNIFSASITFIETLSPGETAHAVFTWPLPLPQEPVEIEIVSRSFPDRSYIK